MEGGVHGAQRGGRLAAVTTKEMLSSDEPCAMATTFASACASAPKTRAAMPGVWHPEPTTAIVASPVMSSMPSISWRAISSLNSSLSAATARGRSASGTVKQIDCSDDAWEMSETEIPSRRARRRCAPRCRARRACRSPAR